MYSIRKWFYKPKKDDSSVLAQFFYADEELNLVAAELDSFDGRKDPERCTVLVNQLRQCQDKVLNICNQIMEEVIPGQRAVRDFRVKFPDDVLQENLAGQLWFGAECLAAGSSILNREVESSSMRPLAKRLTKMLDNVRSLLREQSLRNPHCYSDKIRDSLIDFDCLFAEFELCYVSAMVPVKSMKEHDMQQDLIVLFSETLQRALQLGLLTRDSVDDYDPALMFTIPRLAIVCGLLIFPDGPLNVDGDPRDVSEMFRPFQNLLHKIRDLLWTLSQAELFALEKTLCSVEDAVLTWEGQSSVSTDGYVLPDVDDYLQKLYRDYPSYKQFISDLCSFVSPRTASDSPSTATSTQTEQAVVGMEVDDGSTDFPVNGNGDGMSGFNRPCSTLNDNDVVHQQQKGSTECLHCRSVKTPQRSVPTSSSHRARDVPLCRRVLKAEVGHGSPSSHHSFGTASTVNSPSNWDSVSCYSTDTSSYNSECQDDEEIALAIQAAEIATRQGARARFKDVRDLIHRLFVCIAGVADQLQTNYASDLRNILKCVFEMNCSHESEAPPPCHFYTAVLVAEEERVSIDSAEEANERGVQTTCEEAPSWIPDELAPQCMSCEAPFNLVRRRHHCRNCGKVFCGRCSSNSVPLPRYGLTKPVRVCNRCFMFQVTPFMIAPPPLLD